MIKDIEQMERFVREMLESIRPDMGDNWGFRVLFSSDENLLTMPPMDSIDGESFLSALSMAMLTQTYICGALVSSAILQQDGAEKEIVMLMVFDHLQVRYYYANVFRVEGEKPMLDDFQSTEAEDFTSNDFLCRILKIFRKE